jgi:anti-sigma factor RsiW
MTMCETIQPRLTAYLDGELAGEDGSVVRGHLRECAACRQIARDEAALRDALRVLPPVDPPPALWAGVQAQLAAAEVADARKPRWRRAIARWTPWARWAPTLSQLAAGGLVAAAAVAMLTWRAHRADEPVTSRVGVVPVQRTEPQHQERPAPVAPVVPITQDVTADLLAEPAQTTASYGQVIEELMGLAGAARVAWSDERRTAFAARIAALRDGVTRAAPGRAQQRAQRVLIRYLQGAVIRDDVVLASGGSR